jgi:hypothetical protein
MHGITPSEAELEQLLEQMDQAIYDGEMTRRRVRRVHVRLPQAAAAIAEASKMASREFLEMMLRRLPGPPTASKSADLRAFMDRHLLLSSHHTPTRFFYPTCPP